MDDFKPNDVKYLRSAPARHESFVRFRNQTPFSATLVWINYEGKGVVYSEDMTPTRFVDVNSFAGHKWVAIRSDTRERLAVNGKVHWSGEPWMNHPGAEGGRVRRQLVNLTVPAYTLRELCIQTIRSHISSINYSELPSTVADDLRPGASFFYHLMPFTQNTNIVN